MTLPSYSVVIATYQRPADLRNALESLVTSTHPPQLTLIVDASPEPDTRHVAAEFAARLNLRYRRADAPSAAVQRNQGAREVETPLIAFLDDDAVLHPETAQRVCTAFAADPGGQVGGICGRMVQGARPVPRGLLWWYYRLQAGYSHPTYGGKLFGAGVCCHPSFTPEEVAAAPASASPAAAGLIPADWLPCCGVWFRTELFRREEFPRFPGYSFMEDVHLSGRIARTHALYFHPAAPFDHFDSPSSFKRATRALARTRIKNQRLVAEEVLGLRGPVLWWKLTLHRLFVSIYLLRRRGPGVWGELLGIWL